MSAAAASPNSYLLAILLITQARAGDNAQVAFHYPPDPFAQDASAVEPSDVDDEESSTDDSSSDSSSDESPFEATARQRKVTDIKSPQSLKTSSNRLGATPTKSDRTNGKWRPSGEPLLGLGEDSLVSLLAPGRAWSKRKFELGVNDLTFVGRPVYAREDGSWARRKRPRKSKAGPKHDTGAPSDQPTDSEIDTTEDERRHTSEADKTSESNVSSHSLTMFHLVFVLNPPPLEQTARVKDMYDHVAKKLSKILKVQQAKGGYVREQSELIHSIKDSHTAQKASTETFYSNIQKQSNLAGAIGATFRAISLSRIAAVSLGSHVSVSMQIPPVTSTSYLPSLTEQPIKPGLWLTTANDAPAANSDLDAVTANSTLQLAKTSTLLLLENPQKITKDIQASGGLLTAALTNFVDKVRSTKSFYKISVSSKIYLADVQLLARHLIYWRRAIAIPMLHRRDTYIVSPNADMSKLVEASKAFETAFPMLPSLPRLLNLLSQTPTPYGTLAPSSDHKEEYYRVLAWLMRGGWVTQLRTFAFVRVDPHIKKLVRERDNEAENRAHLEKLNSGKETASNGELASAMKRPSIISRLSSDGRQSVNGTKPSQPPNAASLIMSPLRASGEESKWLSYIADSLLCRDYSEQPLTQDERQELYSYWPIFAKYFNGSEALERIPIREGLKRKFMWDMLGKMGLNFDRGVHGDHGDNTTTLVTVRHW